MVLDGSGGGSKILKISVHGVHHVHLGFEEIPNLDVRKKNIDKIMEQGAGI